MNLDFLKNPIYASAVAFILTILYIYLKNLTSDRENVETSEYFTTSSFVALLCGGLIYFTQKTNILKNTIKKGGNIKIDVGVPDF
jgi:hypothetical protein